jgi:uncharacterized protein (TIGR02391 family)
MFERPTKGDLDRSLSLLMHEAHHKVMDESNRIKADAIKAGALQSNRVIVAIAKSADEIQQQAMEQAKPMLLDFIERMQHAPVEITNWARPHLENLGNTVLGSIPPNGFPADHRRIVNQYRAVFQQRLDNVLRDVEIGFVKGAGFARADQVESKEEWITAREAAHLLKPVLNSAYEAQMTICKRAHTGLIRSHAQRFIMDDKTRDNFEIPKQFWWAEGHQALKQNWPAGDFDPWVDDGECHLQAFGVSFLCADIEKMIPTGTPAPAASEAQAASAPAHVVGAAAIDRPTGFDDLLHPNVREAAIRHYQAGDYRNAVLDTITAVFDKIRERTGIDKDGERLINEVFSVHTPLLILSEIDTDSGRNDQSGFADIFRGFYRGVRNPKAHSLVHDLDAHKAGQHLVLASILMRRVVEARLVPTE